MNDSTPQHTPNIETRIIFISAENGLTGFAERQLETWLNEGFAIVTESNNGGRLYIRLERDNVAYAEQQRWEGLTQAERISENINALGMSLDGKGD